MTLLVAAFLALGVFLQAVATIGMLRLPDFYTRIHTVGKADTSGIMLVLIGVAISEGLTLTTLKLVFVIIFYFLANPAAAHAIGHAALRAGVEPWTKRDRR
jgi:multicomponent Na+:H+ antiporter subunit G